MPLPLLIPAVAKLGTLALPKLFQGAKGLFKKGKKLFKGLGKKLGKLGKNKNPNPVTETIIPETQLETPTNENMNYDEQINDSDTNTQKAFLGLQSVSEAKKSNNKIIMIAGAIILVLFFFMKKK